MERIEKHSLENRFFYTIGLPLSEKVVIWFASEQEVESLGELYEKLSSDDVSIVLVVIDRWDAQLTPWCSEGLFKKQRFTGEGEKTLAWMQEFLHPWLHQNLPNENVQIYLMGYSLAGLFSLWASYGCEWVNGVICCSASLWYKGFVKYVREHPWQRNIHIYMSLGDQEANTKQPVLATVERCSEEIANIYRNNPYVKRYRWEHNPGNHFQDVNQRMLKGLLWMNEREEV